ncbi:protein Hook homolog 3-like [Rhopilema esculentum]|uniref:protein Hook homolog 3-like n=1 Tax=Rhopilema esculentum TaxID=499914 RepID=UPI0031DA02AA
MDTDDNGSVCENLIKWLGTFPGIEAPHYSVRDLTDGVAMAEALTQIAPEWFDPDWMSKLKRDISGNYRLKISNLKKVLKGMLDYFSEVLNQDLSGFNLPDVCEIAENNNEDELSRMIQLILGCAVNCEEKEQYIQVIMGLEEEVQHDVMNAIQELLAAKDTSRISEPEFGTEYDQRHKETLNQVTSLINEKEELLQKIHDLEDQVQLAKEERSTLVLENEQLRSIKGGGSMQDQEDGSKDAIGRLNTQIDRLKEENFSMESAKEDYRIRLEQVEKDKKSLNDRIEQLSELAEEARSLKDEMDVLRHTQDKVAKYEATIETYKKKLEELQDMRKQMKSLQEKNNSYMQQTISMEEELKKAQGLKVQIETFKKQIYELHSKNLDLEKKYDKAEFESKRAKEKQQMLEAENERLKQERNALKETNEELTLNSTNQTNLLPGFDDSNSPSNSVSEDFLQLEDPDIRSKFIRMKHENKMLKLQIDGNENEKIQVLQSMLDDIKEQKNVLETENRPQNQKLMELEGELEDALKIQQNEAQKTCQEEQDLKKKLHVHLEQLREASDELQRKKSYIDDLESRSSNNSDEIVNLKEQLVKKDADMRQMEERYKKYLEKAKQVIRTLDPKQNSHSEIQQLRNQLQDKEKMIEHLERDHERMKVTREREEKLIISAWYDMCMRLHRKAAEERLVGSAGLSFLARQRQAAATRRATPAKPKVPTTHTLASSDNLERPE